jgi:cysteine-rich repeat protein
MSYPYASLAMVATLGLAGCNIDNPLFMIGSVATDATDATDATSAGSEGATQTSEPVTSTTGGAETGETSIDPQTSGPGTSVTVGSTEPMTGGSTTGGVDTGSSGETGVAPGCGNGVVDMGEGCDDGNAVNGDECTNQCTEPACGDGILQAGESCDDGNQVDDDGCTGLCVKFGCGDGVIQLGEECDAGANNSDVGSCTKGCKDAKCGDKLVWVNFEACDAGILNGKAAPGCSVDCKKEIPEGLLLINILPFGVSGNLGGVMGADMACGEYFPGSKAMIADGADRVASKTALLGDEQKDWVLSKYRAYGNENKQLVFVTGSEALLGVRLNMQVPLLNPIGKLDLKVWTGLAETWQLGEHCGTWKSNSAAENGDVGNPIVIDASFIGGATLDCSSSKPLYCVQQM